RQDYDRADLTGALGVVVGSEGKGMRRLVRERCDFLIRLPMKGLVTSLNASVAGSVVLYEVLRQRRQ
ncbi:MAG: 23S rRNA (guanosine(2251)-2'-O)-methyltransferase RlmB, partial [Anaerolineae bacterium]|nr:23S rRNA (guanosine(2251)-2'-O)-methyltransferase RlmB [Anaerolineae bacterium]